MSNVGYVYIKVALFKVASDTSMYVDDSALYTSATTVTEMTAILNKELQLVSEWVARNHLALHISKTKSIAFGTKHSQTLNLT